MNKVAMGLVFLALAIWGGVSWWWFLWDVLKGVLVLGLFASGLILVGLGVKDIGGSAAKPSAQ
jgi:hypothetical protein